MTSAGEQSGGLAHEPPPGCGADGSGHEDGRDGGREVTDMEPDIDELQAGGAGDGPSQALAQHTGRQGPGATRLQRKEEREQRWRQARSSGWLLKAEFLDRLGLAGRVPDLVAEIWRRVIRQGLRSVPGPGGTTLYDPAAIPDAGAASIVERLERDITAARAAAAQREREHVELLGRRSGALVRMGYPERGRAHRHPDKLVSATDASQVLGISRAMLASLVQLAPTMRRSRRPYAEGMASYFCPLELEAARNSSEVAAARAEEEEQRHVPDLLQRRAVAMDALGLPPDSPARRGSLQMVSAGMAATLLGVKRAALYRLNCLKPGLIVRNRYGRNAPPVRLYDPLDMADVYDHPEVVGARRRTPRTGRRGSTASSTPDRVAPADEQDVEVPEP